MWIDIISCWCCRNEQEQRMTNYFWIIWAIGIPLAVYFLRTIVLGKDDHKYPLVFCAALWPLFVCGFATWKSVSYFASFKETKSVEI